MSSRRPADFESAAAWRLARSALDKFDKIAAPKVRTDERHRPPQSPRSPPL